MMLPLEKIIAADVRSGQRVFYEAIPVYGATQSRYPVVSNYMPKAIG